MQVEVLHDVCKAITVLVIPNGQDEHAFQGKCGGINTV